MDLLDRLLRPDILGVLIPIVAIISVFGFLTVKAIVRHRERLAMIERGMRPDHPLDELEAEEDDDRIELDLPRRERMRDER